jgi:hypothetical protein
MQQFSNGLDAYAMASRNSSTVRTTCNVNRSQLHKPGKPLLKNFDCLPRFEPALVVAHIITGM